MIEQYLNDKESRNNPVFMHKFKKFAEKHGLYLHWQFQSDRAIRKALEIVKDKKYKITRSGNNGSFKDKLIFMIRVVCFAQTPQNAFM